MSREISLFANYHSNENTVTNYCGLILKLIYEDSPKKFEELLLSLTEGNQKLQIGPIFRQQVKKSKSIPDLTISQQSFDIYFETKLKDWFYDDQVNRHIFGFEKKSDVKILFLLADSDNLNVSKYEESVKSAQKQNVILQKISYEDLLGAMEKIINNEFLENILDEFKNYLDQNNLLPKWKTLLDVVSCSGSINEIENGAYMCPDKKGAYSHRRAKYFGPYSNKQVNTIYEIDAVVSVDGDYNCTVKWTNTKRMKKNELCEKAISHIKKWQYRIEELKKTSIQVFLLSKPASTKFYKSTSGGMQQSKLYFWNIASKSDSSETLAQKLFNRPWSEFR